MIRYLAEIYKNDMKSSGEDLLSAIVPLMKLLSLTVIGLVLAHPKTQIIPKATFKLLSKLVFALFLPCLIFTELGESITLVSIARWWFIPVNVLISTFVGCLLAWVLGGCYMSAASSVQEIYHHYDPLWLYRKPLYCYCWICMSHFEFSFWAPLPLQRCGLCLFCIVGCSKSCLYSCLSHDGSAIGVL